MLLIQERFRKLYGKKGELIDPDTGNPYTAVKFAKRLEITPGYIYKIGEKDNLSSTMMLKLHHEFGVSMNWLILGEGEIELIDVDESTRKLNFLNQLLDKNTEVFELILEFVCEKIDDRLDDEIWSLKTECKRLDSKLFSKTRDAENKLKNRRKMLLHTSIKELNNPSPKKASFEVKGFDLVIPGRFGFFEQVMQGKKTLEGLRFQEIFEANNKEINKINNEIVSMWKKVSLDLTPKEK